MRHLRVVRGRVVDADGRPVEGVELDLFGGDEKSRAWVGRTTSGAGGAFAFEGAPEGAARLEIDALPRPDQALVSLRGHVVAVDEANVVAMSPGAGVRARVLDAAGAPLGGPSWRLWLDPTISGWPPRDRREEYAARLAAIETDPAEFERFASLPGSAGGEVSEGGVIALPGLECGAYWVQLSRVYPDRRRVVPSVVEVEAGQAEVSEGTLVLFGAAAVVVRAVGPT